jgi:hypothetical protein
MTDDKHQRARWVQWSAGRRCFLFARKCDGGQELAHIEERAGAFFWGLGNEAAAHRCESLYSAQRAVRKALKEQAQG